jgi:ribosomal protein L37AE/L43A
MNEEDETCPVCFEPSETVKRRSGGRMCDECAEHFENKETLHDYEFQKAMRDRT